MSETISPNTTLAHYSIVAKIGAGGMGEVYLAHDQQLDRKVALKLLPAEVAANQERMRRLFRKPRLRPRSIILTSSRSMRLV